MDLGLKGKRALVTGSTAGIGLAVKGNGGDISRKVAIMDCILNLR